MHAEVKNISGNGNPIPRKIGLSCAECRRSKLKCDRVFPCQSCIRRGCANICPDGALTATKGNKVLMAHAEKLSEQVKTLTLKVQQLETALTQAKDKSVLSETQTSEHEISVNDVSKAIGSLSIGFEGQARYHGESAGSEYFQELLPLPQESESEQTEDSLQLPIEIIGLMNAFPFGLKDCLYIKSSIFMPYIPLRDKAIEIINIYYAHVAWMYDPIVQDDLMASIVDPIYTADLETLHSHRLAVFFMVLANGYLYDTSPTSVTSAREYQALGRAALSFDPILQEVTCATVQAIFLLVRFAYNSDRRTNEERWLLTGLIARISQVIGLQRDSEGWNLGQEEVQRRRRILQLFWELFTWDSWTAIVNGRPPALLIQYADCQFPDDLDPFVKSGGESELGWHAWKFRYAMACLAPTVQHIFSTRAPPYSSLLELDKTIRRFGMPAHLRSPNRTSDSSKCWSLTPTRAMQQYCALCVRESNLLYIHRSYFAQAIRQESENPLRHIYAPSVLATYRSACRLISALRSVYVLHPQITGEVWFFWSGIFSACIVLGALVVESPGCTLARDAIQELDLVLPLYEDGSKSCRGPNSLAILQKLRQRAATTYNTFRAGSVEPKPRNPETPSEPDELEVLGGRNTVIARQTPSNPPSHRSPGSSVYAEDDDSRSPTCNAGAAEMLVEYFEELGNPNLSPAVQQLSPEARDGQVYAQQNMHYQHLGTSNLLYTPYQGETPFAQYAAGTGLGVNYQHSSPSHTSGYRFGWEGQHNLQYPLVNTGRPPNAESMMHSPHFNVYQYPVRQEHGQAQDEIWRNFISDYNAQ